MKNGIKFIVCLFSYLFVSISYAGLFTQNSDEVVSNAIHTWMAENNVPGAAVVLYVDGKPFSYYYGYADKEKKTPVTEATIFEMGAVSEVMTNLMVAEEIDFAKMSLKDPLKKYISDLPVSVSDSTLQEIATHTVDDTWNASIDNTTLLATALEKSTTKDYDWLYFHHVSALLGMKHLGLVIQEKYKDNIAQGYGVNGSPVSQVSDNTPSSLMGLKSSGADMQKFLSAAIGLPGTPERVFYPMRMTQSVYIKLADRMQGLGWQIHPLSFNNGLLVNQPIMPGELAVDEVFNQPLFDGNTLIDKAGLSAGFGAYIAVMPDKKSGIVILTNKHVSDDAVARVGRQILFKLA